MTSREIQSPESAIDLIVLDPLLKSIVDLNIARRDQEFGDRQKVYNNRMFLALRNGHNEDENCVTIYCMGGNVCSLKYNRQNETYQRVDSPTYFPNGISCSEDIGPAIQQVRFLNRAEGYYADLFGSFFYGLNPLCGLNKDLFLVDSDISFAEARDINNFKIDYAFLKYVDGTPHVLFVKCAQTDSLRTLEEKNQFGRNMQKYKTAIDNDRSNIIKQYNFVIDFYNKLGEETGHKVNLGRFETDNVEDLADRIKLGFVVFYQNNQDEKNFIEDNIIAFLGSRITNIRTRREAFPGCGIPFELIGNRNTVRLGEEFEKKAIGGIVDLANMCFPNR